jgi:hypothetical protein
MRALIHVIIGAGLVGLSSNAWSAGSAKDASIISIFGKPVRCPSEDPEYCAWHRVALLPLRARDGSEVKLEFAPKKFHSVPFATWSIVRTKPNGERVVLVTDEELTTIATDRQLPPAAAMFLDQGSIKPSLRRLRRGGRDWLELDISYRSVQFADVEAASSWPERFDISLLWRFPTADRLVAAWPWPVTQSRDGTFMTFGPFIGGFAFSGRGEFGERDGLALGPRFELTSTEEGLRLTAGSIRAGIAKNCGNASVSSATPEQIAMEVACARWRGEDAASVVSRLVRPLEARAGEEIPFLRRWVAVDLEQR